MAQINPHSLYNTLSLVKDEVNHGNSMKSALIIQQLSDLFRYSLAKGSHFVKVSEELNHAQKYLSIMNERYGGKFTVHFDIESNINSNSILEKMERHVLTAFQCGEYDIYLFNMDSGAGFVFRCQPSSAETGPNLPTIVEIFRETICKIGASVSIGISKTVMGMDQLPVAYVSAQNAITRKFANPDEHIFLSGDTKLLANAMIIGFAIEQKTLAAFEKTMQTPPS